MRQTNGVRALSKPLAKGSRIAVIAPSSPAPEGDLEKGLKRLETMGFAVVAGKSCCGNTPERGYLAARSDEVKVEDIHWAFSDPSIDGIVCMRGGSGAGRLIRHLDAALIAKNPKVFVGYSDITILHTFIAAHCGFVTFHGPMATSSNLDAKTGETRRAFLRAVSDPAPLGYIQSQSADTAAKPRCLVPGTCTGELAGGNLAVLCTTIGTPAETDTRGKIVLLEDFNEEPYSVDRMLSHLLNAGKLSDAAGILLGDFTKCEPPENSNERTVDVVVQDLLLPLGIPILAGLHAGHGRTNITLPLGAEAEMDASAGTLRFRESLFEAGTKSG